MFDISKLQYLSSGRGRDVYLLPGGKYVLKVPRNAMGRGMNDREHCFRYLKDPWARKERVFARCRLIPGTWLLVMEKLESHNVEYEDLPQWAGCIDGTQVGLDRKGRLKAYDFGG